MLFYPAPESLKFFSCGQNQPKFLVYYKDTKVAYYTSKIMLATGITISICGISFKLFGLLLFQNHILKIKDCMYSLFPLEQHALKKVNNCLNANIYSYLETTGGQSSNLYLNVVHFFNTSVN